VTSVKHKPTGGITVSGGLITSECYKTALKLINGVGRSWSYGNRICWTLLTGRHFYGASRWYKSSLDRL